MSLAAVNRRLHVDDCVIGVDQWSDDELMMKTTAGSGSNLQSDSIVDVVLHVNHVPVSRHFISNEKQCRWVGTRVTGVQARAWSDTPRAGSLASIPQLLLCNANTPNCSNVLEIECYV